MASDQVRQIRIAPASAADRDSIYRLRHTVYASELGQHRENPANRLSDALDEFNIYIAAFDGDEIIGFVSVTPPGHGRYSIDKYFQRDELPFPCDDRLYEVRLLTVAAAHRGTPIAGLLMYAAVRWILAQGGERIVAIGRHEVLDLYRKVGLRMLGRSIQSGAVRFELMTGSPATIARDGLARYSKALRRLEHAIRWQFDMPLYPNDPCEEELPPRPSATCYHGGAFWNEIGDEFDSLDRAQQVVPADVLDAWFPPAPSVIDAIRDRLPFLLRTSPPTGCEGLISVIARARNVEPQSLLPGPGSSSLIFQCFQNWLTPRSRVLLLDPTYGEYAHVLERVIGCSVDRLPLQRENNYQFEPAELLYRIKNGTECRTVSPDPYLVNGNGIRPQRRGYDLVVLVNPNSPTGQHVDRKRLESALSQVPEQTRVWLDETYVEYAGVDESLEQFAARSRNVIVCKSMSKVYALSGARAAYICGPPEMMDDLRTSTPPWSVSLPAQVAAVAALNDPAYYAARYHETHLLRAQLEQSLRRQLPVDIDIVPGIANFILCHLPESGPDAATVCTRCRAQGVFLRDARSMSPRLGRHAIRIAVRDSAANERIVTTLAQILEVDSPSRNLPSLLVATE